MLVSGRFHRGAPSAHHYFYFLFSSVGQFALKYEELYASTGVDSTAARRDAWKLQWLGVIPDHRRRGIGRALIQAVATKVSRRVSPVRNRANSPLCRLTTAGRRSSQR